MRERERLLDTGKAMKKNKVEREKFGGKGADGEWEDVEEGDGKKEQTVYVLDRGFVGWQEKYGEDARLTEGYRKEIWSNGYWM
jgi:hypothetical protein